MNSDLIPLGPSEVIGVGSISNKQVLMATALTAVTFTGLAYIHPPQTPNAAATAAGTIPAGTSIYHFKSITISAGSMAVIYKHTVVT